MQRNSFFLIFFVLMLSACSDQPERIEFQFKTMGTIARCDLELPPELSPAEARSMAVAICDSVTAVFNTWQENSELSRLNNAPTGTAIPVSPWLRECLAAAERLHILSDGAFDPTAEPLMRLWGFYRQKGCLPSQAELDSARALLGKWDLTGSGEVTKTTAGTRFDLGGIAKGLAVDKIARRLQKAGVDNGLIDLGGNLFCLGGASGRHDWRVGLRDPLNRDRYFASVAITGLGISTSGSYERFVTIDGHRYGHIMNPATGRPAEGVLSATVFAPTALLADGLSTAMFVLGQDRSRELLGDLEEHVEAILVIPGRDMGQARVLVTPGLANRVTLAPEYEELYQLVTWFQPDQASAFIPLSTPHPRRVQPPAPGHSSRYHSSSNAVPRNGRPPRRWFLRLP